MEAGRVLAIVEMAFVPGLQPQRTTSLMNRLHLNTTRRLALGACTTLALLLLLGAPARAAMSAYTWTGGTDSDWTRGANWSGGTAPPTGGTNDARINVSNPSTGKELLYTAAYGTTVIAGTGSNPRALVIGLGVTNSVLRITGGVLEGRSYGVNAVDLIGGNGGVGRLIVDGGTYLRTNDIASDVEMTIGYSTTAGTMGELIISNGLARIRQIRLNENSGAAVTGNVWVVGGTLEVGNVMSPGSLGQRNVYLNGETLRTFATTADWVSQNVNVLVQNGGAVLDTYGFDAVLNQPLQRDAGTSTGGLTKNGNGTLTLGVANTYYGSTLVNLGILRLGNGGGLGNTANGTVVINGARLELTSNIVVSGESVTISGNGGGDGTGCLRSISGTNEWAGAVMLGANQARLGAVGGDLVVSGAIGDGGNGYGLVVRHPDLNSTNTVVLSAVNTYGGKTEIYQGSVRLAGGDNRLPVGTTLSLGFYATGYSLSGRLDLNGRSQLVSNLIVHAAVTDSALKASQLVTNSSPTLSTLIVSNAAASRYDGVLAGNLAFTKAGNSVFTLGGTNTHTGDTTVSGGTLALAGSCANSTNIVLVSGATLDVTSAAAGGLIVASGRNLRGNGSVLGAVNIAAGGVLSPGASLGTMSFSTNLVLAGQTVMELNKSGAVLTNDRISCASTVSYGGTLTVTATGDALALGDSFQIFSAAGYNGLFSVLSLPDLATNLAWNTASLPVDGTIRVAALALAPTVDIPPQSQTADMCSNATFTIAASGAAPLTYLWFHGTILVASGVNSFLSLSNLTAADAGDYTVVVTNIYNSATSSVATLTVVDTVRPVIVSCAPGAMLFVGTNGLATVPDPTGQVVATDCTAPLTVTQSPAAGASVPAGTTNVTLTVRDPANNAATCTATLTVLRQYGPGKNAPESADYTLLYSLPIPSAANYNTNGTPYTLDHHRWVTNCSRVAYYVELQPTNGPVQFLWAAMDPFSANASQLGVPSADTGAAFDQGVANLDVRTSVTGVATGSGLSGGQIKFSSSGAGKMQLWLNGNVLFAFNGWGNGSTLDLGLGNNNGNANPDWTGMSNAPSYAVKRLLVYVLPPANPAPVEEDVVVYGGTSGGVMGAVQAARMGKRAVLVCTDNHLGGMTTGGLGATDTGNIDTIGGLSREFYRRIGQYYGMTERFNFEPHVAEQVYAAMLAEAGVQVVFNQHLASVAKTGARITELTMTNGAVYQAKVFLDTTYEGDLLAAAGVSFTVGREGTNTYGESFNGIRPNTPAHQFSVNVDPYVVPGNPASGLLPYIQPGDGGTPGDGDTRVQAYNFRLCLTTTAANKMSIQRPIGYDVTKYELLARYIQAQVTNGTTLTLGSFMNVAGMPSNKTDINNNGAFSTDYIGMNYDYPATNDAGRTVLWQAHEDYIRGFFYLLANDTRVPAGVRSSMSSYGLSQDEFLDTGGWPHALYVREARRMVSDYIMTQADCLWRRSASDSVGLASYNMDSHNCQRVVQGGWVRNEGDFQQAPAGPFPISYRSIVPRASECENLLTTFCLSSSHVAFNSCRLEPVFMMTSQSAGTAAAFAIDDNVPVQQVSYEKLSAQLLADGQKLAWGGWESDGIIVDNTDATGVTKVGSWSSSTGAAGYWGSDYLHDGNADKGTKSVTFTPTLPSNGLHAVYVRWTENVNRANNAPVDIVHTGGTTTVLVNQTVNGGRWMRVLTTNFVAGTSGQVVIRTDGTTGYVVADAVRFVPAASALAITLEVVAGDPVASELGGDTGRVSFVRTGDTNGPFTFTYTLGGTAGNGVDYAALPTTITLPAGVVSTTLVVTALSDTLVEGDETVVFTLQHGADYALGTQSNATVTIHDAASINTAQITGQVELESFAGPALDGVGTRTVTFKASTDSGTVLATWIQSLPFTGGAASFTLTNAPSAATHLSAKTQWNLRKRLTVAFANDHATASFTGLAMLPGGDTDDSNAVDTADYFNLAASWYLPGPTAGDVDGSGRCDLDDYFLMSSHWGEQGSTE